MALKILRLEERIVLEAAVVDALDAAGQAADQTDPGADTGTDQGTDPGADHSPDAPAADGAAHADPVHVLLVSSHVDQPEVLTSAAVEGVLTYVYDGDSNDLDAILSDIQDMLGGQQADSIAFASHSSIAGQFLLSGDHLVSSDTLASDTALADFWEGVGDLVKDGGSVDILACDAASGDTGLATLDALKDLTGVDVFGSDDATGNPDAGGDWILEAGDIDLTARYFDADALADYDSVLASAWMVKDLNTSNWGTFNVYEAAYAGGKWIVSGAISGVGCELFFYDSVNETFTLIKDINPGNSSSDPTNFCVLNNVLYFQANDGVHGRELWKSTGTEAGTVLVKDINPGAASSTPHNLCAAEGRVFFAADDGTHGIELWKTNGSETYTVLVQDINPGADSSDPKQLIEVSGHYKPFGGTYLYFTANDGTHGRELWISVGGTTKMVADINPGAGSSNPQDLTVTGDLPATRCIFYTADDGTHGRELWLTNSNGTRMVVDMVVGSDSGGILDLCEYDGDLYFVVKSGMFHGNVESELWWHNGYGVQRLNSVNTAMHVMAVHSLQDMGSYLALVGVEYNPWPTNAYVIKITYNGVSHGVTNLGGVQLGTPYNSVSFVSAGATDYCVTANHVYRLGSSSLDATYFISSTPVAVDDAVFFLANSTLYRYGATGDRTEVLVERVDDNTDSSNPSGIINVGGTLYFYAEASGVGAGLWKSDGTEAGTVFLKALNIDADTFTVMGGDLYFVANDSLWTTDGTAAGTVSILDSGISVAGDLYVGDGVLYFRARQGSGSMQLFKSDGTPGGTTVLDTVDSLPSWAGEIETMLYVDGYLYYAYRWDHAKFSMKRTDGTVDGTITLFESVLLLDNMFILGSANGELYFYIFGNYLTGGAQEIWKTDGTEAGTVLLDYMPIINNSVEYNGELYFQTVRNGVAELWRTNGTEAGTVLVKTLGGGTIPGAPMEVIDGLLYFAGSTAGQGVELWTSDGTEAGTTVVKDINTGSGSSTPTDFTLLDGVVYFTADDGVSGRELWRTDGTEGGTVLVKDVRTGSGDGLSTSAYLTALGDDLFFAGNDGTHGFELWTYATLARDDDFSFYEDVGSYSGNLFDDNGHGADSDNGGTITLTSANGAGVGVGSRLGNGTLTVLADGSFTYAIDPGGYDYLTGGQSETLNFTYETLVNGISCTGHVTFTILGRNSAPVVVGDTKTAYENTVCNYLISELLGNDYDPEGGDLTLVTVSSTSARGAIVTFNSTHVRYNPNGVADIEALGQGATLTDTFTYTVRDELGATTTGTVTLTVHGYQEPPVVDGISDQSFTENAVNAGYQAIAASATVADSDSADFDGGMLLVSYEGSSLAEDSLTVMSGVYETYLDGPSVSTIRLGILLDGNEVRYIKESQAQGSTDWVEQENVVFATVESDGQAGAVLDLRFNANATRELVQGLLQRVGYANDSDMPTEYRTVRYIIDDGDDYGSSQPVYQVIQVTAENDGPVPGAVTDATDEDTSLTFNVADLVAQATDPEGHGISFTGLSGTSANNVVMSLVDGVITYDPTTSATVQAMTGGATAQDTFTYLLVDSEGAFSVGTVTIDLTGINDAPEISGLSDWTTSENTANVQLQDINTAAATVIDAEGLDFDEGVLSIDYVGSGLAEDWLRFFDITYDENAGTRKSIFSNADRVYYAIEVYDSGTGTWGSSGSLLIGNIISWGNSGGALAVRFNQRAVTHMVDAMVKSVRYANTSDDPTEYRTLSYTLSDGDGQTSVATEQVIRVTPDNDAPTAVDDTVIANKDAVLTLTNADLTANDTDPDNDSLSISLVGASANGATVTLNGDGSVSYDPSTSPALQALAHGVFINDTFDYTVSDSNGGTSTATVTVRVTGNNEAPTAGNDFYYTNEETSFITLSLLINDSDPDAGDTLSVVSADTSSTVGTVTDHGNGFFEYDPGSHFQYLAVGETATDTFVYTVSDGLGGTDTATVIVTITGVNDAPTAVNDTSFSTDEDTAFTTGSVLANDTEPDASDTLTVIGVDTTGTQGTVSYNGDGTFDYDPSGQFDALARGATATDSFTYTVSDGHGGTSTATVTITISGLQEAPLAVDDGGYSVNEDSLLSVAAPGILANDTGDGCSISVGSYDTVSAHGATVTVDLATGAFSYDPRAVAELQGLAQGETITDTFTYLVLDQYGMWSEQEAAVSILVTGVNDPPVAVDDAIQATGNAPIAGNLVANDVDVDNGSVLEMDSFTVNGTTYAFAPGATEFTVNLGSGTLHIRENGDYLFTPGAGRSAAETFTYLVRDEQGAVSAAPATVSLTVTAEIDEAMPVIPPGGQYLAWSMHSGYGGVNLGDQGQGLSGGNGGDVGIQGHGSILAQGLRLLGDRDNPWGFSYPDQQFNMENYPEYFNQAADAFNETVDAMPGMSQLTRIALKDFNADILDLLLGQDMDVSLNDLQAMANDLGHMVEHMAPAEMARFRGVLLVWVRSLKVQASAMAADGQDVQALLDQLSAIEQAVAALT